MNITALQAMSDEEFTRVVVQAAKRRTDFPDWWRVVLHPDLIDDTEDIIRAARADAVRQSENPQRYPHARGFVQKMDGVLAEITLARITGGGA